MNDHGNLQDQQSAAPRPVVTDGELQPVADTAPLRPVAIDGGFLDDGGDARPTLPRHDDGLRPGAAGHGQDAKIGPEMRQAEPNDGTRPGVVSAAADSGANAAGRGHLAPEHFVSDVKIDGGDSEARPVATGHDAVVAPDPVPDVSKPTSDKTEPAAEADPDNSEVDNKAAPREVPTVAPPASPTKSADLVTVEEAVTIFTRRAVCHGICAPSRNTARASPAGHWCVIRCRRRTAFAI